MPTAVVLLRRDQTDRNARFCSEYIGQNGLEAVAREGGLAANMLLTRWPLAAPGLESTPTQCDRMLLNYDFSRAAALIAAFTKEEGGALGQIGPHILVLYPDGGAIIVDGSSVPTSELRQWSSAWVGALRAPLASTAPRPTETPTANATRQENVSFWERARRAAYTAIRGLGRYGEAIMGALTWAFAPVPAERG